MGESLRGLLEPIAGWFNKLGVPEPIIHWGHPLMMGIVVFVLGSFVAYAGWQSRLATDGEVAIKNRTAHRQLAPLMYLFIVLGSTGGLLSLVMQGEQILTSPHFLTGAIVLVLLGINAAIAFTGFGGEKSPTLRSFHAYLGSAAVILLFVHAILGLNLGLAI
ncbi:MAG: DUF4079 domain-containing protein [Prochloraceae cyanobacterium]